MDTVQCSDLNLATDLMPKTSIFSFYRYHLLFWMNHLFQVWIGPYITNFKYKLIFRIQNSNVEYGNTSCGVFKGEIQNYKDFWLKINCGQMKSLNFENWLNGEVSKSAKIWLSKSIFYIKNHLKLSDFFFIKEYEFRSTFFVIDIFW